MSAAIVTQSKIGAGPAVVARLSEIGYDVHAPNAVSRSAIGTQVETICSESQIDLLVNNHPHITHRQVYAVTSSEFSAALDEGLHSVFSACREAAISARKRQRPLLIINIVSSLGVVALPGRVETACISAAVIAMSKALAAEWGNLGIRVSTVLVGPTDDWRAQGEPDDGISGVIPLGRTVSDKEVAEAVSLLASTGISATTGHGIVVDNGWLAHGWRQDD